MAELLTAEAILAAARTYNDPAADALADWTAEELEAALDLASPYVKVIATRGGKGGVKCVVYAGIDDPREGEGNGGWAAEDPRVVWLKDTDGRLSAAQIARRASRYLGLADAGVDVRYENGRR